MMLGIGLGISLAGKWGGAAAPAIALSATSVAENAASGTAIGTLSGVNLAEGVTVSSFAITADPDSKFAINADGTTLETAAALDYETATSHSVTIQATLSDASTLEKTVTITVTNIPELSNFTVTPGETDAVLAVDTDTASGMVYFVIVPTAATAPDATEIQAGTDGDGNAATWAGSVVVSTIDTYDEGPTGLTAGTTYDAYAVHVVGAVVSAVVTDEFTTTSAFETESETYFAAMSVEPDATRKGHINDLIAGLKTDGVWANLTWFSLLAAHDEQMGRINAKTPAQVATAVNTPTFTVDRGFQGNGTTSYLQTGIAGTTVSPTDASIFVFIDMNGTTNRPLIGYDTRYGISGGTTSKVAGRLKSDTTAVSLTSIANDQFSCISRTGTTQELQVETITEDTDTVITDAAADTRTIRILANESNYSDARLSAAGWGLYLNATQRTALRNRLRTYLTAVGSV